MCALRSHCKLQLGRVQVQCMCTITWLCRCRRCSSLHSLQCQVSQATNMQQVTRHVPLSACACVLQNDYITLTVSGEETDTGRMWGNNSDSYPQSSATGRR